MLVPIEASSADTRACRATRSSGSVIVWTVPLLCSKRTRNRPACVHIPPVRCSSETTSVSVCTQVQHARALLFDDDRRSVPGACRHGPVTRQDCLLDGTVGAHVLLLGNAAQRFLGVFLRHIEKTLAVDDVRRLEVVLVQAVAVALDL